jgi:hypothetical protein
MIIFVQKLVDLGDTPRVIVGALASMSDNIAYCTLALRYLLVTRGYKFVSHHEKIPTKIVKQNYLIVGVLFLVNIVAPVLVIVDAKN